MVGDPHERHSCPASVCEQPRNVLRQVVFPRSDPHPWASRPAADRRTRKVDDVIIGVDLFALEARRTEGRSAAR
jgi:hypothetical protein